MNLGKIWQKAKDLYGWDQSQLYYWKDKRAYYKLKAGQYKHAMGEAKNKTQFEQAEYRYKGYQSGYEKADFNVHHLDFNDVEEGWRN